jgi:mRNA interferase MazF
VNRGDIYDIEFGWGVRPAVIITRDVAIPVLRNVTVAEITSRVRDLPTEVTLERRNGLTRDCVANCDNLWTIPKTALSRRRGELAPEQTRQLNEALRIALALDR